MKLTLTNALIDSVSNSYVRINCIEKGIEQIIEKDNQVTLQIVAGKLSKITPRTFRTFIRGIIQSAKKSKLEKIVLNLNYADFPKCHEYNEEWFWSTIAENLILAEYEYTKYKSTTPEKTLTEVLLVTSEGKITRGGVSRGTTLATYTNVCRDLANTPGGDMTPSIFANDVTKIFTGTKAKVTILDFKTIQKLKMGGLVGVGKGAQDLPKFVVIEYFGKGKSKKKEDAPIVFVGKGITFDTGGLQVKPGMAMYEMHMDMSGGSAVVATLATIVKLGLKKNIIGLIPVAENAIGDKAMRPGDVLTMMSGATVDVLHTDAEGRIILADALHYARKYEPKLVIDIATLTGAALVAVGQHASVIMTKSRRLEDKMRELGEESGDYVFPLPLWSEYKQYIKGVHGDIANIPAGDSKYGGSINGGMFLAHFTKKMKWVHIDMAPRMTSVGNDKLAKGATGEPVRLLVKIAETF